MVIIDGVSFNKKQVLEQFTFETFCETYRGHFRKKDVKQVASELGLKRVVVKRPKKKK
jgi:hypothetical protein